MFRGGRFTLINSLLDALPSYMMSMFPVPGSVIKRLGSEDKKKFHMVKWVDITVCKEVGGMGIKNLKKQNQSLMMKMLWKFTSWEDLLWKDVIIAKYAVEGCYQHIRI